MQEVLVVMVDVGPQMSEHLVHLRKSLFLLAESKVRKCWRSTRTADDPAWREGRDMPPAPCPALAAALLTNT
jgi:hypothetical protein